MLAVIDTKYKYDILVCFENPVTLMESEQVWDMVLVICFHFVGFTLKPSFMYLS